MGLLDVLNGMQNGPRGERRPGSGGMSPMTMALLGLLAYKAYKKLSAPQPGAVPSGGASASLPAGNASAGGADGGFGGLGDLLKGGLGGLLAGGTAGAVLSGGLNDLLKQFQEAGHGDVAKSWVGTGPNQQISPQDLEHALGSDALKSLAEQAGLSKVDLLSGLSQQLPALIDQLTPQGRVPTESEMSRMI